MKTIALTLALLALSPAAVAGDTVKLPKEYLGPWCYSGTDVYAAVYKRGRCKDPYGDGNRIIRANGYDYHEGGCKTIKSSFIRSVYLMEYRCDGEGDKWAEKTWMYLNDKDKTINILYIVAKDDEK
jgi:hypothetical protein